MENAILIGAVSLATPIIAGIIVALGAALETRTPAPIEDRAVRHER